MELSSFRPEKEQRTIMFIECGIVLVLVSICIMSLIIFIPDIVAKIIFSILLSIFLLFMVLWAFWIPAYFKTLEYSIGIEAIKMNRGVFWKRLVNVPYHKVTNVDVSQGPLERMYNLGTIHVQTAGAGGAQGAIAELRMNGVREFEQLKDAIMEGVKGHQSFGETYTSSQSEMKTADISNLEILQSILIELKAIRNALEK